MTTLVPRRPYSDEELERLYPRELNLQLVQVVRDIHLPREYGNTSVILG